MTGHVKRTLATALLAAVVGVPAPAEADVTDGLFQATIAFEQAYLGDVVYWDFALGPQTKSLPTFGASLRMELLVTKWIGLGVEGNLTYFRLGEGPSIPGPAILGATSYQTDFDDDRHLVAGTNGFLRLRFGMANGLGEYYLIGGAGPASLGHDVDNPDAYGVRIRGNSAWGWTAYARLGVRGELVPGFGGILEIGWIHREHIGAFHDYGVLVAGIPLIGEFDYVVNQLSITIGWYVSR